MEDYYNAEITVRRRDYLNEYFIKLKVKDVIQYAKDIGLYEFVEQHQKAETCDHIRDWYEEFRNKSGSTINYGTFEQLYFIISDIITHKSFMDCLFVG